MPVRCAVPFEPVPNAHIVADARTVGDSDDIPIAADLLGLSQYEKEIEMIQRAVRVSSSDAEAWEGLGNAYAAIERYRAAQRAYRCSIELDPQSSTALVGMSVALMKLGEDDEALGGGRVAAAASRYPWGRNPG